VAVIVVVDIDGDGDLNVVTTFDETGCGGWGLGRIELSEARPTEPR
jgi:hypothetical protein